jgi:parvulin-like peptidyl-prolyl isomerase
VPRKSRRAKIPTPAWERPRGTLARRLLGRGSQFYGAVFVVLLIAGGLGFVFYGFGSRELEKLGRPGSTAIQVDDTRYRLDYFTDRLTMYVDQNGGPTAVSASSALPAVSDLIIQEDVVRRFADELDVTATDDEIKDGIATRLGITADDESFDVVFQQELTRTGLSEKDYRQMVEASVLSDKLQEKFLAKVPKTAESVHYRQIVVSDQATADDIKKQIEAGGDFAALAAKNSLDTSTKDKGGDVGWVPRGVLTPSTEELLFALEPGATTIIPYGNTAVLVIQVLKKDDNHPVADDMKDSLAASLLSDWINEKKQSLSIVNNVDITGNYDPDKVQWVIDHANQS